MGLRTNTRRAVAPLLLLAALAATVAACGGNDGDAGASSEPALSAEEQAEFETASQFARCMREHGIEGLPDPQISENGFMVVGVPLTSQPPEGWLAAQEACQPVVDEAASPDGTADAAAWERIVPRGDCQCSDGSEFSFWVREANPKKVVFFLEAGGACFSAETCAPERDLYNRHPKGPGEGGIFDFADGRNPFADYSVVYVPYCTGDVHIGDVTTEYAPGLAVHHKGYANGTAALDHLAAAFPGATDVVVIGESAGSIAAPLYAGLVSDRLPDARITVLADGSGSYPNVRPFNEVFATWGFGNVIPPWPENAGLTAEQWSAPELFIQSARHDPEIVFARHDYAYDEKQEFWYPVLGVPAGDLLSLIDANETQIESAGVNLLSYIAPGEEHTVMSDGGFYTETVNGEKLVDWVTRLIEGEPVDDVHCTECGGG
jgi:hypothetical protein